MDGQISTSSFIPKTKLTAPVYRRRGLGLGIFLSLAVFLLSFALYGGVYFYKKSLQKQLDQTNTSLKRAEAAFELTLIDELERFNAKINAAKILLEQHQAASKIFNLIGSLTLKTTKFSNFNYSFTANEPIVTMSGETKSYTDVAIQARIFEDSDSIERASFSGLALKEGGKVSFNVEIIINPQFIVYKP
jgi:hypothetical protein